MKKRKLFMTLAAMSLLTLGGLASCNGGSSDNPTPEPTPTPTPEPEPTPEPAKPAIKADKEVVTLDEVGKEDTVTLTLENIEGVPTWEATDEEAITLTPSEDGKSCKITNVKGGKTVIVTATLGEVSVDITVKSSAYGDTRVVYEAHKEDGALLFEAKGFFNAIGKLNDDLNNVNGYITKKGATDKLYTFQSAYLNAVTAEGTSDEFDSHEKFTDGKAVGWFKDYALTVDSSKKSYLFTSLIGKDESNNPTKHAKFNRIEMLPIGADKSLFKDGNAGFSTAGDPTKNVWSGFRTANYIAGMAGPRYITWADPYAWKNMDMTWDLSKSSLIPSYNADQETFAQIYLGSSTVIKKLVGVYFDAGSMEANKALADGAERDIYTFTEVPSVDGGFNIATMGEREIGTTSIGKAKWDAFNKYWTFPEVTVNLKVDIKFSNDPDCSGNYTRDYTITGFKANQETGKVNYLVDAGKEQARVGSSERSLYGVTLTPKYTDKVLPDFSCGAKWLNVIQSDSIAEKYEALVEEGKSKEADNLQWTAGRTVNYGNQVFTLGANNVDSSTDADGRSIFSIHY